MTKVLLFLFVLSVLAPAGVSQRVYRGYRVERSTVSAEIAATNPDPGFPLRVHLFTARYGGSNEDYHGYGVGELRSNATPQSFEYTFECSVPFHHNAEATDVFQARWTKPSLRLQILLLRTGTDHEDRCELRLAMRSTPFDPSQANQLMAGQSPLLASRFWQAPDVAFTGSDPAYPLHLHVSFTQRAQDVSGAHGSGAGFVMRVPTPDADEALDFAYDCAYGFLPNSQREDFYLARWVKADRQLEILMQRTGEERVDKCKLNVTLRDMSAPPPGNSGTAQP